MEGRKRRGAVRMKNQVGSKEKRKEIERWDKEQGEGRDRGGSKGQSVREDI